MLTKAHAAAVHGIGAEPVEIEVHALSSEDPRTRVVGLPDTAVKESIDRVHAALRNSLFRLKPASVTVNLAPADLRKEGPVYDLPIALALLATDGSHKLPLLDSVPVLGELALSGEVRRIRGVLPITLALRESPPPTPTRPPSSRASKSGPSRPSARPSTSSPAKLRPPHTASTATPSSPKAPPAARTSPTSKARPSPGAPSRLPSPAATTSSSSALPAAARP